MFRPRPEAPAATIAVAVEGRVVMVPEGASAAAAVLLAGLASTRDSAVGGRPRGPYCMMGICFDCLAEIDGVPNRQSCMVVVRPGMVICRQQGARGAPITNPDAPPTTAPRHGRRTAAGARPGLGGGRSRRRPVPPDRG